MCGSVRCLEALKKQNMVSHNFFFLSITSKITRGMWQDSQTIVILQFAVKILKCNQLCYFLLQKNSFSIADLEKTDTLSEPGWQLAKQLGQKYIIRIIFNNRT